MDKQTYLKVRANLYQNIVDNEAMTLFYDYWKKFRLEEFQDPSEEDFASVFLNWLGMGMNFMAARELVCAHYDKELGVTYLKDKTGKILTIN